MNDAEMSGQEHELLRERALVLGHLTDLLALRQENAPTASDLVLADHSMPRMAGSSRYEAERDPSFRVISRSDIFR